MTFLFYVPEWRWRCIDLAFLWVVWGNMHRFYVYRVKVQTRESVSTGVVLEIYLLLELCMKVIALYIKNMLISCLASQNVLMELLWFSVYTTLQIRLKVCICNWILFINLLSTFWSITCLYKATDLDLIELVKFV